MTQTNGARGPYQVKASAQIAQTFKDLHQAAPTAEAAAALVAALKTIHERLRNDPGGFGEPLYRLSKMKLRVRVGIVKPLVVEYGVYEERPLVFIKKITLLDG
jgi:hypothetical protein